MYSIGADHQKSMEEGEFLSSMNLFSLTFLFFARMPHPCPPLTIAFPMIVVHLAHFIFIRFVANP